MGTVVSSSIPFNYPTGDRYIKATALWPASYKQIVYLEEPSQDVDVPSTIETRYLSNIKHYADFLLDFRESKIATGRQALPTWRMNRKLAQRLKTAPGSAQHRYDAVRWCRQLVIPFDVVSGMEEDDIFVWLDADAIADKVIPDGFVERLIGDSDLVSPGRGQPWGNTDIGFWAARINSRTRNFCERLSDLIKSRYIFYLQEWRSGYAFDVIAQYMEDFHGMRWKELARVNTNHIWLYGPLAEYIDHMKGTRKHLGYSPERKKMFDEGHVRLSPKISRGKSR